MAAQNGNEAVVRLLLERGAEVDKATKVKCTQTIALSRSAEVDKANQVCVKCTQTPSRCIPPLMHF